MFHRSLHGLPRHGQRKGERPSVRDPYRARHDDSDASGSCTERETSIKETELAIVGAGPAGLAAAVEASRLGIHTTLLGEGTEPGGQLLKQTHKFFGMRQHYAGVRGIDIPKKLLDSVDASHVQVRTETSVLGLGGGGMLGISSGQECSTLKAETIILATGAIENAIAFPGWTLPGVMGAGALQTMINQWRVAPGRRCLIVGSGNVGLIVGYQLLQAGLQVAAVLEAAPCIGGYAVHAEKLLRYGVPIMTSSTIQEVLGTDHAERATAIRLDNHGSPISGSEMEFAVDVICLAVGLRPLSELAMIAGCEHEYEAALGGFVPIHAQDMETTMRHIFVAGDVSGVEEASVALEEGRLAALGVASSLRKKADVGITARKREAQRRLSALRSGPAGKSRREAKERLWRRRVQCRVADSQ